MPNIVQVKTKAELKQALQEHPDAIEIIDPSLAKRVSIIKAASGPAIAAAMVAAGGSAAMAWNPAGLVLGVASTTIAGPLVASVAFLLVALGIGVLWALHNEWDIDANAEISVPGGMKLKGGIKLTPRKSK